MMHRLDVGSSVPANRPIDLVHLARQTLGDASLEREVLELFLRQSRALTLRIREAADPKLKRDLAHTLKGSAKAIGAWHVAQAAEGVEDMVNPPAEMELLGRSVDEACSAIEAMAPGKAA